MKQVVIPMQIFIGDTAELRYSFHNSSAKLSQACKKDFKSYRDLPISAFCGKTETASFSIKSVHLIQTGEDNYTLSVVFVPWKVGEIQLPSYDLGGAISDYYFVSADGENASVSNFNQGFEEKILINFEKVDVLSIIEQKNLTAEINPPQNPKLLPGTIYGIYFRMISVLVAVILLLVLLIKHKTVNLWIENLKLKIKYRKNRNATLKNLKIALDEYEKNEFQKADCGDCGNSEKRMPDKDSFSGAKKFASEIQKILRNYLEVRFNYPFKNAAASEIVKKYYEVTLSLLSDEKNECIEEIGGIFLRTDFIRYGADFSDENKFSFSEGKEIVEKLKNDILIMETSSEKGQK